MSMPSSAGLVMFSGTSCPACVQSSAHMKREGILFEEVKVDGNLPLIRQLAESTGKRTIPQFFFNGGHLPNGLDDVTALRQQGKI